VSAHDAARFPSRALRLGLSVTTQAALEPRASLGALAGAAGTPLLEGSEGLGSTAASAVLAACGAPLVCAAGAGFAPEQPTACKAEPCAVAQAAPASASHAAGLAAIRSAGSAWTAGALAARLRRSGDAGADEPSTLTSAAQARHNELPCGHCRARAAPAGAASAGAPARACSAPAAGRGAAGARSASSVRRMSCAASGVAATTCMVRGPSAVRTCTSRLPGWPPACALITAPSAKHSTGCASHHRRAQVRLGRGKARSMH